MDNKLISKVECQESLVKRTSIIPCYLYTHIKNQDVRDLIESYVIDYSLLYTRGSIIANLSTIKQLPVEYPKEIPLEPFCSVPIFLTDENILKKCFKPERWNINDIDQSIIDIITEYKDLLDPYLPRSENLLSNCGWDNAINHMGSSYLGNIKVQILHHLPRRIVEFLQDHSHEGTDKYSLKKAILEEIYPVTNINNIDMEIILNLRNTLGINYDSKLDKCFDKLNDYNWSLHLWLQKNATKDKSFSILPVSTLNRKYAYIDYKIANSLIPLKLKKEMLKETIKHKGSELQKILGLTSILFNKTRDNIRRHLRNKEHNIKKQKNQKKVRKKKKDRKWKKHGRSSLPSRCNVASISTDGVGLRICCEFIPERPIIQPPDELFPEDSFKAGIDTGRVRIVTSVDSDNRVFMMTRRAHNFFQRDKRLKKWETDRMTNTPWGIAIAALSAAGGFKNTDLEKWIRTLEAQKNNIDVIMQEQLLDKERAKKKMCRFRWKKSWLDKSIRQLLAPGYKNKRHMILGIGDGKFACTGKGEMAVPTTGLEVALKKAIKMLNISRKIKVIKIDEYNTTKCCHKCGNVLKTINTCRGFPCQRYRSCTNCGTETAGKRRHRDVNAARNILKLLDLQIKGLLRPKHLECPWKKYVALPPLVRTA